MTNITIANHAIRAGWTALATVALFSSLPAAAQDRPQELVHYGDLDLTTDAGQSTLDKRIGGAVKRVCSRAGYSSSEILLWNQCRRETRADANAQMHVAIAKAGAGRTGIAAANLAFVTTPSGKR